MLTLLNERLRTFVALPNNKMYSTSQTNASRRGVEWDHASCISESEDRQPIH